MQTITTENKPIKMWLEHIEDGALEQAKNLANLPFIHQRMAIMPDSHEGYGMPIGGVIATEGVVIPNDEANGAYKDIDEVMENQKDLVKILVKLKPLGVIKG